MIAIIDYKAGNVSSVKNTLNRLNAEVVVTSDPGIIKKADKVIMPGVGEAKSAIQSLNDLGLITVIKNLTQPFLGICLGMQILCSSSEERTVECIGVFDQKVKAFPAEKKVPHMGWNSIGDLSGTLFKEVEENLDLYFVHSYYVELSSYSTAVCEYILPFCAALQKDNYYATQFHVEKSADVGDQILKNFLQL